MNLTSIPMFSLVLGCVVGILLVPIMWQLFKWMTVQVEDETAVLVIRFGKFIQKLGKPGLHFLPQKILPWIKLVEVSLQRDFREYQNIHVNDCRGTTVIIDFWVEFRIVDPEKALFQIEDWERSLKGLVTHSATSILCAQEFKQILTHRNELGDHLRNDIKTETARWGIEIEMVMVQKVSLLPDVSRQMFATVAAKLEKAKADFEEEGRLRAAQLEADVSSKIAALVGEAKGQYAAAIGRAYSELSINPAVLSAYQELYDLSVMRPHKTVSFQGFSSNDIRDIEAAMVAPNIANENPMDSFQSVSE